MGIFRPEVTKPLGITKPVLAWGGGIERIAMLKYGVEDVREFYNNNLDGQFRKDGSNKKLIDLIGEYDFINFKDGVEQTYDWYANKVLQ